MKPGTALRISCRAPLTRRANYPTESQMQKGDYNKNIMDGKKLRKIEDPDAWQANLPEGNLIDYKEFDVKRRA